ncbi:hypothetical protein HPB48_026067 [Haemaphysalis longicornis]|uniref:Uncharacterized protein n=1 Tax=Haemaphysalis longicornis TaxID=44386 RepID=A0A9J6H9V0_HAELO|nr:hypothetical protein HPB48_026067 [Haemaphysalis longicornis]
MHKAAHLLKAFYPQMLQSHLPSVCASSCLRGTEENFTDVNELIGSAKALFLKAPSRVRVFKEMLRDVSFPPETHRHTMGNVARSC